MLNTRFKSYRWTKSILVIGNSIIMMTKIIAITNGTLSVLNTCNHVLCGPDEKLYIVYKPRNVRSYVYLGVLLVVFEMIKYATLHIIIIIPTGQKSLMREPHRLAPFMLFYKIHATITYII